MAAKMKVAVLQYDADSAELSRMVLEPLGYEVQIIDYTSDPIVVIKACHPDVPLMGLRPEPGYC